MKACARGFELTTTHEHAGRRLDAVLSERFASITRSQIKSLIGKGHVLVDGVAASKAGQTLEPGQRVSVTVPAPEKLDLAPHDVGIEIIHEDDALAVLNKPAGLSVHPSTTESKPTVVHGLLLKLKSLSSVGGSERPGIVHRIDKGTSGVLVVSKTDAAHHGLSAQFKAHSVDRRYLALVYGDPARARDARSGRIETFFGRHRTHRKKMTGRLSAGRQAVTNWRVTEQLGPLSLVECRLETGRTHQIRVHLSELGFPIVGDPLYCDNERRAKALAKHDARLASACAQIDHQLLHAAHLGFRHPTTDKTMAFDSPLPPDFSNILELARERGR